MSKHTPTPWWASDNTGPTMQGYSQSSCVTGTGAHRMQIVAGCFKDIGGEEVASANAAFIVKACNSHDKLLTALRNIAINASAALDCDAEAWRAELADIVRDAEDAIAAGEGHD